MGNMMAVETVASGAVLLIFGIAEFFLTGSVHPTALIPAWFGLVLTACGWMANTENSRTRMIWMHVAVTVGLVGFLFPAIMSGIELAKAHSSGVPLAHAAAVHEQLGMAGMCALFTVICVQSFIAARRLRQA
jgi:hypothetical protein